MANQIAHLYKNNERYRLDVSADFQTTLLDLGLTEMSTLDSGSISVTFDQDMLGRVEKALHQNLYTITRSFTEEDPEAGDDEVIPPPVVSPYDEAKRFARLKASFFVTGGGGAGKSYLLWEMIMNLVLTEKLPVTITAITGLAADTLSRNIPDHVIQAFAAAKVPLPVVTTFHAAFGPPSSVTGCLGCGNSTFEQMARDWASYIKSKPDLLERWTTTTHFIDEISMMESELWEVYCMVLVRLEIKANTVVAGDFFQLPPVGGNTDSERVKRQRPPRYCFVGEHWRARIGNRVCVLNKNYRTANAGWEALLARLRTGQHTEQDKELLMSRSSQHYTPTDEYLRVFPIKNQVNDYNELRNARLLEAGAPAQVYKASVSKVVVHRWQGGHENITDTYANHSTAIDLVTTIVKKQAMGQKEVQLCVGSRVMLMANVDIPRRLVNGARGVVVALYPDSVDVAFDHIGTVKIKMRSFSQESAPFRDTARTRKDNYEATVHILPLALAFAITIHKVQGTTLDKVYVQFTENHRSIVFEATQIYVALSRVRCIEDIIIDGLGQSWDKINLPIEVQHFYQQTFNAHPTNVQQEVHVPKTRPNIFETPVFMSRPPMAILYLRMQLLLKLQNEAQQTQINRKLDEQRKRRAVLLRFTAGHSEAGTPRTPGTPASLTDTTLF